MADGAKHVNAAHRQRNEHLNDKGAATSEEAQPMAAPPPAKKAKARGKK